VAVVEVPDPVPSEGQVVVDIAAAAVNFPDVLVVADKYQIHIPVPFRWAASSPVRSGQSGTG
jgi:NADPH2:quinone reductase